MNLQCLVPGTLSIFLTLALLSSAPAAQAGWRAWLGLEPRREAPVSKPVPVPGVPREIESLPVEMRNLPLGVKIWFIYETDYLSRAVDERKILSPTQNDQNPLYSPEAKNVFRLMGVWIPAQELAVFDSRGLPSDLRSKFERTTSRGKEYLLLIHPESESLYENFLRRSLPREEFLAVATASSRSLLVWKPGEESRPFIAKVSLNKTIGHSNRSIKGTEAAMSVGVSMTLEGSEILPKSALFMNESFSVIPKGMERGGMILRSFPSEFLPGASQFLPLFALYGDQKRGILADLIRTSGLAPETFVIREILRPFVSLWTDLAVNHGVLMEPHAQNVLIEMRDGRLTGRFALRDFGGFNVDFEARRKAGLYVPSSLPTFSGDVASDYYFDAHQKNITTSLRTYFEGGFLYNVETAMNEWARQGILPPSVRGSYSFHGGLIAEISSALSQVSRSPVQIGDQYEDLEKAVLRAREIRKSVLTRACRGVFAR